MVRQIMETWEGEKIFVSADAVTDSGFQWLETQWQHARLLQEKNPDKKALLAIDEIQKIGNWHERNEEVDFILERRGKVAAIEVKSGKEKASSGLKTFAGRYPHARLYRVGEGGIPIAEFLKMNPADLL